MKPTEKNRDALTAAAVFAGVFFNRRSNLSVDISMKPEYISSQFCSDQ